MKLIAALAVFFSALPAATAADPTWQVDVRASYTILGAHRSTGGVMPVLAGRHLWWSGSWALGVGGDVGVFGLGSSGHWLGVLAGPVVSAETRPFALPLDVGRATFGAALAADVGRIPLCNAWPACFRFWGLYPRAEVALGYVAGAHLTANIALGARLVNSAVWTGVSWEPTVGGRFSW